MEHRIAKSTAKPVEPAPGTSNPSPANHEIETTIRQFITRNLLFVEEGFSLEDDASFLEQGVLDSLGMLELVTFVGQAFGVRVEPEEVGPENFDSVARLAVYIRRKQKSITGGGCVTQ